MMFLCTYVGNIRPKVTEGMLAEVFSSAVALEGCKLVRIENSSSALWLCSAC